MDSASRALMNLLQIGGGGQQRQQQPAPAQHMPGPAPAVASQVCDINNGLAKIDGDNVLVPVSSEPSTAAGQRVEVRTFTMYASTASKDTGRLVASNANYIAYVVKVKDGWAVRVLHLHTARKGLLRGHAKAITDMCFAEENADVIATVDERGDMIIHRLREASDTIEADAQLCVRRTTARESPFHRVAWLGEDNSIVAASHDTIVELYHLGMLGSVQECERADLGGGVLTLAGHTASIRAMAVPEDGSTLVTASDDGSARFWNAQGNCLSMWQPFDGAPVAGVAFVRGGLVTGSHGNTALRLWERDTLRLVQSVQLQCGTALSLNMSADASGRYIVLSGDPPATAMFVLAMPDNEEVKFVELREFAVAQSILSFVPAGTVRVDEEVEGDDEARDDERTVSLEALYVYAVQTKAIQQLCLKFPPPAVEETPSEAASVDVAAAGREMQLVSPLALLAEDQSIPTPTVSPAAVTPIPTASTPPPPAMPAAVSPVPVPVMRQSPRPHSPFDAMPPAHAQPMAPALDVTGLLTAVESLIRQSEGRITAHVDANLNSRWAAFETQQQSREKAAEERLHAAVLDSVQRGVDAAVTRGMSNIEQTLRTAVSTQLDRDALAKTASDAMVQPLTSAFVQIIHQSLVPAYEALTQTMMSQLKTAMDNSTADYLEHVQRETRVHGQPLAIQSTLRELQASVSALKTATDASSSHLSATLHSALDAMQADVKESLRTTVKAENRELLRQHSATAAAAAAARPAAPAAPAARPASATSATPPKGQPAATQPPAQAAAGAKQVSDEVWTQINKALINEDYASAFSKALSSMSLAVVLRLCRTVDIDGVLRQRPCPLSQPILLSLIQQLSVDLLHDTPLKVHVIAEALRGVDPQSPVARQHLPTLVPQIANNIRSAQAHLGHTAEGASLQALLAHLTALA